MQRLLVLVISFGFSLTALATGLTDFESTYKKMSKTKSLNKRKAILASFQNQVNKARDPKNPTQFLAVASFKDVFTGFDANKLNASSCKQLKTKMANSYYPDRSEAGAPSYLVPTIGLVNLVCKK